MKKSMTLLASLALASLLASCGQPQLSPKKTYQIIAKAAPRCIEVKGNPSEVGSTLQLAENMGTDIQKWFFIQDENGFYQIVSKASGKCLEVSNSVIRLADNLRQNQQKWIVLRDREGYTVIISRTTAMAFDLTGGQVAAGTPVGAYWTHAAATQKWSIVAAR